ncbi:hypothetical protein DPMN_106909 [Dreissena polymorpha]|uniref:Uncharacterized protein n=1 Tax=Dreissena polymorpha TaxID=45954 RepID=A0A9D4QKH9_DREPO|nr:hypothetical protein DPMN_106909 [Dreissena polymorpha]
MKASRALGLLMKVAKTEKISPESMVKLYKSFMVPHLEFVAPVWQCSSHVYILEKVQRKGLRICLGGVGSDKCMALVIQSCILPLDFSVGDFCKIVLQDNC